MTPTDFDFLKLAGMTGLGAAIPRALLAAEEIPELAAQVALLQMLRQSYPKTKVWGYGGAIPGQKIRLGQGEWVRLRYVNELPQCHCVWACRAAPWGACSRPC